MRSKIIIGQSNRFFWGSVFVLSTLFKKFSSLILAKWESNDVSFLYHEWEHSFNQFPVIVTVYLMMILSVEKQRYFVRMVLMIPSLKSW